MCGIVGEVLLTGQENHRDLSRELDLLRHRGPNDQGQFKKGPCVLGHVRLSIIDLSSAGRQPFSSSCGRWQLVFNGELYNYLEIKEEYKKKGVVFKTTTDTEVLLELLIREGIDGLQRCNGMFAFALWDCRDEVLLLARDRFGIKPLFLRQNSHALFFASEIKALLSPDEKPQINEAQLYHFIDRHEGYRDEQTLYSEITKVLPGQCVVVKDKRVRKSFWYELPLDQTTSLKNYAQRCEYFRDLLVDSIKLRLRSDVPVGVNLSGGVDSSVITGVISKELQQDVLTFSSVYGEPKYNEAKFIHDVNQFCGAQSHQLTPCVDDFDMVLTRLINAHDRPVRMPGTYSHWHVMQCAAKHVQVVLDGQGADELLGGYRYYYPDAQLGWVKRLLRGQLTACRPLIASLMGVQQHIPGSGLHRAFASKLLRTFFTKNKPVKRWQDQVLHSRFIEQGLFLGVIKTPCSYRDPLTNSLLESFCTNNLPMLLDYEDRISMAWSLEARVPFLDHRLVEFSFSLPSDDKIFGYTNKRILRDSMAYVLPESVKHRKDKLGFPTPTEHWFRLQLKEYVEQHLFDPSVDRHGVFDRSKIKIIWNNHLERRQNNERLIWRVLSIEKWLTLIDGQVGHSQS